MKKILLIGILTLIVNITSASEIKFSPDQWNIKNWCLVATDVFIDTNTNQIAATDIVMESSLEYMDFVPNKENGLFPYFFPPKTGNNIVHIIGFISDPKKTVSWSWIIGKLFFRQRSTTDTNGSIKLYFAGKWKTYDSNLSILWGKDILDTVGSASYTFSESGSCEYPADYKIIGWFSHMSPEAALQATINKIKWQQWLQNFFSFRTLIGLIWLIIIILLFIYFKKKK